MLAVIHLVKPALVGFMLLAQAASNSSCGGNSTSSNANNNRTTAEQIQMKEAGQALYEETASKVQYNNELHQIADYMIEMSKPGTVGYVVIYPPAAGQSTRHFKVKGKVLPCDAQLTPDQHQIGDGQYYHDSPTVDQSNDMGSYGGKSGNEKCVFFYTTDGVMVQTNNEYDYTSMPMADEPQAVQFKTVK
jgi:hypothetical protein